MVAESDPKSFFITGFFEDDSGSCVQIKAPVSGKGLIVTQVRFLTRASSGFDSSHGFTAFRNSTCIGSAALVEFPERVGSVTETFAPGLPVSGGNGFSVRTFGTGFMAETEVSGYMVPDTAVP